MQHPKTKETQELIILKGFMVSFQAEIVFFVSSHHFIATIYTYLLIIMYFRLIKSNTLQEECLITKVLEHHLHI